MAQQGSYKLRNKQKEQLSTIKMTLDYINKLSNKKSFHQSRKDWEDMETIAGNLELLAYELEQDINTPTAYERHREYALAYKHEYYKTHKEENRKYMREYQKRRRDAQKSANIEGSKLCY